MTSQPPPPGGPYEPQSGGGYPPQQGGQGGYPPQQGGYGQPPGGGWGQPPSGPPPVQYGIGYGGPPKKSPLGWIIGGGVVALALIVLLGGGFLWPGFFTSSDDSDDKAGGDPGSSPTGASSSSPTGASSSSPSADSSSDSNPGSDTGDLQSVAEQVATVITNKDEEGAKKIACDPSSSDTTSFDGMEGVTFNAQMTGDPVASGETATADYTVSFKGTLNGQSIDETDTLEATFKNNGGSWCVDDLGEPGSSSEPSATAPSAPSGSTLPSTPGVQEMQVIVDAINRGDESAADAELCKDGLEDGKREVAKLIQRHTTVLISEVHDGPYVTEAALSDAQRSFFGGIQTSSEDGGWCVFGIYAG